MKPKYKKKKQGQLRALLFLFLKTYRA